MYLHIICEIIINLCNSCVCDVGRNGKEVVQARLVISEYNCGEERNLKVSYCELIVFVSVVVLVCDCLEPKGTYTGSCVGRRLAAGCVGVVLFLPLHHRLRR